MTMVFTASRCEGLAMSDRWIILPLTVVRSYEVPVESMDMGST